MQEVNMKLIIFSMAGGLALFLYGMKILSSGLQMALGDRIKKLMERLTDNKVSGVGIGALVTAIVQSSSITTVTLVGLINAGMITLAQSIPVIMGANIGTTITAQLVAFKIGKYSLPIIAIGFVMYSLGDRLSHMADWTLSFLPGNKKDRWKEKKKKYEKTEKNDIYKNLGQIFLGFGILFLGMTLMSSEAKHLVENQKVVELFSKMGGVPILGILAGTIFTAIVQSSSAATGLVISLGLDPSTAGLIDLKSSIAFILGANIGTCITVLFASIGSTLSSKRAALAHVLFNIIGVLLFIPFITPFSSFIHGTSQDLPRQIANAHVLFNLTTTIILLPGSAVLLALVTRLLPGEEIRMKKGAKYLDEHTMHTPSVALGLAVKETVRMSRIALNMIEASRVALFDKDLKQIEIIKEKESVVDFLDDAIEDFLIKIDKDSLSSSQQTHLAILNHIISDIERIADHANNISELAEFRINKNIKFSNEAFAELKEVFEKADESIELVIKVILEGDMEVVDRIMEIEKQVDQLTIQLENNHHERLEQGLCTPEAGPIFLDIIRNLERITDHTYNIAAAKSFGF